MIPRFYVPGGGERPASRQTIFADGSADETFRPALDLELSHWLPNRTPPRYKADTSTEICLNFVAEPLPGNWDLAVNNHLDVDGVLSVYVLVRGQAALPHRETLVAASRMGDFWDWGEWPARVLFQGLTVYQRSFRLGRDPLAWIYERCFERIDALLSDPATAVAADDGKAIATGLAALDEACERVERGEIARTLLHERFVHYQVPQHLAVADLSRALHVPAFNDPLDDAAWLPPQARNRWDRERIQLLSVAATGGWYYDLWYPGYRWAETPDSWAAPGFAFAGSTNGYRYENARLEEAVRELSRAERAPGTWQLVDELTPFKSLQGRDYPVILSFLEAQGRPAPSALPPDEVATRLARAFLP